MTSNRNKPAPQPPVPWGQPAADSIPDDEAKVNVLTQEAPVFPNFAPQDSARDAQTTADLAKVDAANVERIRASFAGAAIAQKSPFAPKAKAPEMKAPEPFPMTEDTPSWGEFVNFIRKHGDKIVQARYPQPRGECIDTLYRGVQVFPWATSEVRHIAHGWVGWSDAQYE